MQPANIIVPCLFTALTAAYATAWYLDPNSLEYPLVTIPPLLIERETAQVTMLGGWVTEYGYEPPGRNAVEIRCYRAQQVCTEAVAHMFYHTEGADLDAQTYLHTVTDWTDERLEAVATAAMAGGCLDRRIELYLKEPGGTLEWQPAEGCEEGDTGAATLIGDNEG